jgi:hypothetical protein
MTRTTLQSQNALNSHDADCLERDTALPMESRGGLMQASSSDTRPLGTAKLFLFEFEENHATLLAKLGSVHS